MSNSDKNIKQRKNKDSQNMTSRQRRELRQSEQEPEVDVAQEADGSSAIAVKPRMSPQKRFFIILGVIVVEAIIIFLAIFLPIALSPYRDSQYPVAVITLSNGYELEFAIFEEEVPIAATNFIYLAQIGYFEGAIVYDMQNNFVRFGGFTDENYNHRSNDLVYASSIKDITARSDGRKFVYRLKKDTNSTYINNVRTAGYLSFISSSSTEFQFCTLDDASYGNYGGVSFGMYLGQESLENILSFYNTVYPANGTPLVKSSPIREEFKLPTTTITIEKVKIYNLNKEKWRNFNYDEYLTVDKNLSYWAG